MACHGLITRKERTSVVTRATTTHPEVPIRILAVILTTSRGGWFPHWDISARRGLHSTLTLLTERPRRWPCPRCGVPRVTPGRREANPTRAGCLLVGWPHDRWEGRVESSRRSRRQSTPLLPSLSPMKNGAGTDTRALLALDILVTQIRNSGVHWRARSPGKSEVPPPTLCVETERTGCSESWCRSENRTRPLLRARWDRWREAIS